MMPQQYCLRWKHHHSNVQNMFAQLLEKERFCDVTLYCSPSFASQVPNKDTVEPHNIRGVSLRAHRVVLAACSELLGSLLGAHEAHGEPVLVIDGAEPRHLRSLLDYMYTGEMNVHHSQLASLLKTAEELRIKGLTDIRWNNKDEPPDSASGAVATTVSKTKTADNKEPEKKQDKKSPEAKKQDVRKQEIKKQLEAKLRKSPDPAPAPLEEPPVAVKEEKTEEKVNVNGGPPPLIKLDLIKNANTPKRENNSDSESPSPKRQRKASVTENMDEEVNIPTKTEQDPEPETEQWQHGNMDISARRVDEVSWGGSAQSGSDEEWADAPTDIGSFLDTRLQVIGDNSIDEESNDSSLGQVRSSRPDSVGSGHNPTSPPKREPPAQVLSKREYDAVNESRVKASATQSRFGDVIKLNDYLRHGKRPQFWEENYVKRVMEAVRSKELEMKQAAEMLGVSYGTLYGRYRDVYGCINRPYRAVRDFWQVKGPSEVLERLQRGEISLEAAASALGVSPANLAAHVADFAPAHEPATDFEPIPIEVDPALRQRPLAYAGKLKPKKIDRPLPLEPTGLSEAQYVRSLVKIAPRVIKCLNQTASDDDDAIPSTIITADNAAPPAESESTPAEQDSNTMYPPSYPASTIISPENKPQSGGKWPSIRVASLDSLREGPPPPPALPAAPAAPPASPSQLMKTRPDLTIVAKKQKDENT